MKWRDGLWTKILVALAKLPAGPAHDAPHVQVPAIPTCLGWCLQDCGLCLILGVFLSADLDCLPVLEEGQECPQL